MSGRIELLDGVYAYPKSNKIYKLGNDEFIPKQLQPYSEFYCQEDNAQYIIAGGRMGYDLLDVDSIRHYNPDNYREWEKLELISGVKYLNNMEKLLEDDIHFVDTNRLYGGKAERLLCYDYKGSKNKGIIDGEGNILVKPDTLNDIKLLGDNYYYVYNPDICNAEIKGFNGTPDLKFDLRLVELTIVKYPDVYELCFEAKEGGNSKVYGYWSSKQNKLTDLVYNKVDINSSDFVHPDLNITEKYSKTNSVLCTSDFKVIKNAVCKDKTVWQKVEGEIRRYNEDCSSYSVVPVAIAQSLNCPLL